MEKIIHKCAGRISYFNNGILFICAKGIKYFGVQAGKKMSDYFDKTFSLMDRGDYSSVFM